MKLLFNTPSCITVGDNIDHLKFDAYKVLDSNYDITLFITTKSIKYEIGLKYPEYLPCLNKLKLFSYMFSKILVLFFIKFFF